MKKNNKIKILFISHDVSLTGAPILLLNLINLIAQKSEYDIKILIKSGEGSLIEEFKKFNNIVWKSKKKENLVVKLINKFFSLLSIKNLKNRQIQKWINKSDVIFSNTITNGDFFKAFNFSSNQQIISYVHELEMATDFYTSTENLNHVKKLSNYFLVPSRAVANHLSKNLQIGIDKIGYLNYFIPHDFFNPSTSKYKEGEFKVGIAGTLDWRKGADIFSVVVSDFFKRYPNLNVKFIWKGVNENSIEYRRIKLELKKSNIFEKVYLEKASQEMSNFYNNIDLFLLLSKEDPYPLVVLEAAASGKACICFSEAGGAPEFVEEDAGEIISYLDIEKLSIAIYKYFSDRELLKTKGQNAKLKLKKIHQNGELILNQLANILISKI